MLLAPKQDRKLSDARRDTWAHTSPCATTAPSLRMVLKEEGYRIRIRKSNSKNLSAKPCSQPKTPVVVVILIDRIELCTVKTINQTEKALNKQRVCISFPSS